MALIKYTHIKSSIKTISDLVKSKHFKASGITIGQFVSTTDDFGKTNLERIYDRYSSTDFMNDSKFLTECKADIDLLINTGVIGLDFFIPKFDILKPGTELVINLSDIHQGLAIPEISTLRDYKVEPFMNQVLKDLMNDSDFLENRAVYEADFGLIDRNPKATVWVWSKSLGSNDYLNGKILNITPFIKNVNIAKDKQTGTFSIGLSYVYDKFKVMASSTIYDSVVNSVDSSGTRRRNKSQFHDLISKNDIVFIRLNRLKIEDNIREYNNLDDIQPSDLVGNVYDMIGLVDNVKDGFGGAADMVTVSLTGRDLTKLLTDDGSSIYQTRFVSAGSSDIELGVSGDIFRLWGSEHRSVFQLQDQTIADQLLFVIDYMTRTKICEGLFDANPKSRVDKLSLPDGSSLVASDVAGIWKAIHVGVDSSVANFTSFNSRIGNDYSPILSQLNQVCQEPFVELYTDTYGDQFHIMARKPIFDGESVLHYSEDTNVKIIKEFNIRTDALDYDDRVYSWYKVDIKYLTDAFSADFKWLLPAMYFQEYVDVFGDKPLQVQNPYITHEMAQSNDKQTALLGKKMVEAGVKDFKYLIETNAYLPFTRKGTFTIEGDRTYKRGTWIYNEGSDEMFYVDSVSHSMNFADSTEWTTTLTVSRGMKRNIIEKYFQIIDMPIKEVSNDNFQSFLESTLKGWSVNADIFSYFLKRRQANKLDNGTEGLIA